MAWAFIIASSNNHNVYTCFYLYNDVTIFRMVGTDTDDV